MSDTAAAGGRADAPAKSPLGSMLGLNEEEVVALGKVFTEAARAMGIDGGPIFERLKEGKTLGEALAMPKGVGELLYHRAHRWFSFGRVDKAEPLFRALCILDGSKADHWVGHGVCLRLGGDLDQAELAFETAARLRAEWAVPHFHALELAVHRQNWAAAADRLARFDQYVTPDIAPAIKAEVERLRAAIALRQGVDKR
jgi:hypothetical protein